MDEGDEAVDDCNESFTTRRTRTILTDCGVVGEGVGGEIDVGF